MILDGPGKYGGYTVDGVPGNFWVAPDGIKVSRHAFHTMFLTLREQLGDYGHFTESKEFCCEGNLFSDPEPLSLMVDITPRQHEIFSMGRILARNPTNFRLLNLYKPLILSLPSNDDLKSLLTSCSTRLTNRYLVTRIVQCPPDRLQPGSNITTPLYSVAKPFVWHRNKIAGSVSEERSGDELRDETTGNQVKVNYIDDMKS